MSDQINIGTLVADLQLQCSQMVSEIGKANTALDSIRQKINNVQNAFDRGQSSLESYTNRMTSLSQELRELLAVMSSSAGVTIDAASAYKDASASASKMATATNAATKAIESQTVAASSAASAIQSQTVATEALATATQVVASAANEAAAATNAQVVSSIMAAAATTTTTASNQSAGTSAKSTAVDVYELADSYDVLGVTMTSVFTSAQQIGPGMQQAAAAAAQATQAAAQANADAAAATATAAAAAAAAAPKVYELADTYEVLGDIQTSVFTSAQQMGAGVQKAAADMAAANAVAATAAAGAAAQFAAEEQALYNANNGFKASAAGANAATVANKGAATSAKDLANAQQAAQRQSASFASAMMQFGYIVDDIQYGFKGIVNNIAPFTYQISAAAGLTNEAAMQIASSVQIIGVAAYQAYLHWDELMDGMGLGKVKTEAEEMEELGKKTGKTADETERLNNANERKAKIKKMEGEDSKEQKDREKDTEDAYAELGDEFATGFKRIAAGLVATYGASGAQMTDEEKSDISNAENNLQAEKKRAQHGKQANVPAAQAELREAKGRPSIRIDEENLSRAKAEAADATTNTDKKKALLTTVERNPGAFPPGTADAIRETLPENRALQKEMEAGEKEFYQKDKKRAKESKALDANNKFMDDDVDAIVKDQKKAKEKDAKDAYEAEVEYYDGVKKQKQRKTENTRQARDNAPGVDDIAGHAVAGVANGDISSDQARGQIQQYLINHDKKFKNELGKAQGTEGEEDDRKAINDAKNRAISATDEILTDAGKDIKEKAIQEWLNPTEEKKKEEKATKSEQFDAMSLATKVQGGVGTPEAEQKKSNQYLDQAVKHLARIAGAGGEINADFTIS